MPRWTIVIAPMLMVLAHLGSAQAPLQVPAQFSTIQSAVDAAQPGDTVLVAPGVYAEKLTVATSVSVVGSGAAVTHIVGGSPGPVVTLGGAPGTNPSILLQGFTVRDGIETGIRVVNGDSVIRECVVRDNVGQSRAPGDLDPGGTGGISTFGHTSLLVDRCRIVDNTGGDGATTTGPPVDATDGGAGGMTAFGGSTRIVGCEFSGNEGGRGGDSFTGVVTGIPGDGGDGAIGIVVVLTVVFPSPIELVNTVVADNVGGIPGAVGLPVASPGTGGIGRITGTAVNCILRGNSGGEISPAAMISVDFCNVLGGFAGTGNIDADPLFLDAPNRDYRIAPTSPCVDAGNSFAMHLPATDLEGDLRVIGAAVDIGLDEASALLHPGTGEDFVLESTVLGAAGNPSFPVKPVTPGDLLLLTLRSPQGAFDFTVPILIGQAFPTGSPPASPFPGIRVDPSATPDPIVLFDGNAAAGLIGFVLPPGGLTLPVSIPPQLVTGLSVIFQGFSVAGTHANGIFTSTDAHEARAD